MGLYDRLLRPLAFRFDAEKVHSAALWALEHGLVKVRTFSDSRLNQTLFGIDFPNPLGLAAGFDKNATALDHWHELGFGFVECGTVTFHAQPGNDRPRMFRIPDERAIVNQLGFNNTGAAEVANRLSSASPRIPIGVNIGKSKIAPLEGAAKDYQESFRLLHSFGAYFVVNVSSPNTPGLRSLQEKSKLTEILETLRDVDSIKPLFVKVAPDLELAALDEVVEVATNQKITGLIATNTTISRETLSRDPKIDGGLSGEPLKKRADEVLAHLSRSCEDSMILMGVGGIFTGDDLYEKVRLGAHLCQVYTGWVYGGPNMAPSALERLSTLMDRDGFKTLAEVRKSGLG